MTLDVISTGVLIVPDTQLPEFESLDEILGIAGPLLEIMDIGAMGEGADRYSVLVGQGMARVTGFEPNEEQLSRLKARPGPYTYHSAFLGDGKPARFRLTRYPGCSSLLDPDPRVIDLFSTIGAADPRGNFHVLGTEDVETKRLDDISDFTRPDLIKIDVQGSELTVLQNARKTLEGTLIVECEVEFLPIYKDQPLFCDIQAFFRDCGFVLHKLVDVAGRCFRPHTLDNPFLPISQLLWADAIFVRDFTRLDRYSTDDLIKSCMILHGAYHSYDLVSMLLAEHDRRLNTHYASPYMAHLQRGNLSLMFMNQKTHG